MDRMLVARELVAVARELSRAAGLSYDTLNDAALETGDDGYEVGRTDIWYMKPSMFRDLSAGPKFLKEHDPDLFDPKNLKKTHIFLGRIKERNPEKVFRMMQGEFWSPRGEARNVIQRKGLQHTSMSVGDVIIIGNKVLMVDRMGFEEMD